MAKIEFVVKPMAKIRNVVEFFYNVSALSLVIRLLIMHNIGSLFSNHVRSMSIFGASLRSRKSMFIIRSPKIIEY